MAGAQHRPAGSAEGAGEAGQHRVADQQRLGSGRCPRGLHHGGRPHGRRLDAGSAAGPPAAPVIGARR